MDPWRTHPLPRAPEVGRARVRHGGIVGGGPRSGCRRHPSTYRQGHRRSRCSIRRAPAVRQPSARKATGNRGGACAFAPGSSRPSTLPQALTQSLCASGELSGAIRIPNTVRNLVVTADLRTGRVTCYVDVDAPREGRPSTRVNWLVRQLKNAPGSARVESFVAHARGSQAAELLSAVREDPALLVVDAGKEIRTFRVATSNGMGSKRDRGRGSFIDSVLLSVDSFYSDVLESLRAWSAAPPKLRAAAMAPSDLDEDVPSFLVSTDFSSQDGVTPPTRGGAHDPATPAAEEAVDPVE